MVPGNCADPSASHGLSPERLPCPLPDDPACNEPPHSPLFLEFLASHAIRLTEFAPRYLQGLSSAGVTTLEHAHATAMKYLLDTTRRNDPSLDEELPAAGPAERTTLIDIERLEQHIAKRNPPR
jgi:hypothetical protein